MRAIPNPGGGSVLIEFTLARAGAVTLEIFNPSGVMVRRFPEAPLADGPHSIRWDGRDGNGNVLPAGVYLIRQQTEDGTRSVKVTLTP